MADCNSHYTVSSHWSHNIMQFFRVEYGVNIVKQKANVTVPSVMTMFNVRDCPHSIGIFEYLK